MRTPKFQSLLVLFTVSLLAIGCGKSNNPNSADVITVDQQNKIQSDYAFQGFLNCQKAGYSGPFCGCLTAELRSTPAKDILVATVLEKKGLPIEETQAYKIAYASALVCEKLHGKR